MTIVVRTWERGRGGKIGKVERGKTTRVINKVSGMILLTFILIRERKRIRSICTIIMNTTSSVYAEENSLSVCVRSFVRLHFCFK